MGEERRCTYVTRGRGVHDERWAAALRSNGFIVTDFSIERDALSITDLRKVVNKSTDPVLAGPLDITQSLIGINASLFGLSWGFDLVQVRNRSHELAWITQLSGLIVDSQHTRKVALEGGIPVKHVHVIPWGVDLTHFTPAGPPADLGQFGVPAENMIILSLRALEPLYRVQDIIHGFAQLASEFPNAHLVVGNSGSLRTTLENLVPSIGLKDRVSFIGSLPEKSLPGLLRAIDAYVTASEVDGSSVTLLQAMACGTPVVASNTPGNSEWITSGTTGLLFDVADPADLAVALRKVLNKAGAQTPSQLGSNARNLVEKRADWTQNSRQLSQILVANH